MIICIVGDLEGCLYDIYTCKNRYGSIPHLINNNILIQFLSSLPAERNTKEKITPKEKAGITLVWW